MDETMPIFDYKGNVVASISNSSPVSRFSKNIISELISLTKEAANEISIDFGYDKSK